MVQPFEAPSAPFNARDDNAQLALAGFQREALFTQAVAGPRDKPAGKPTDAQSVGDKPVDPRIDTLGELFANSLLDAGRLEMRSPTGEELFVSLFQQYDQNKEKGVQQLIDSINQHLGGEFKLSMQDDPELTKKWVDQANQSNTTPPDFVRLITMTDAQGRPRGDLLFLHGPASPNDQKI